ncbi:MAG: cyclic pyranopterin monophosphate synthase MoaC [Azospirillaceae bacterium]
MSDLSHFDEAGRAHMVDVGGKQITDRRAVAGCRMRMAPATLQVILAGTAKKGDVLGVARIAGIMAAKRTAELIPLCHPLPLSHAGIDFSAEGDDTLLITAEVTTAGRTGVEMEALTALSVAALTVYDMVKAIDRGLVIGDMKLLEKSGGKSGHFRQDR